MAAHPVGGASYSGDLAILGDVSAQSITATSGAISGDVRISSSAPASASAAGTTGQIAYASGFIYVCVSTNTWQRAAIATW